MCLKQHWTELPKQKKPQCSIERWHLCWKHITVFVPYLNHQRGLCSCPLCSLVSLLWSQNRFLSIQMVLLSRKGEWRLHPQMVSCIWQTFGEMEVDLFGWVWLPITCYASPYAPIAPGTGHSSTQMAQNQFVCFSSDSSSAIQNTVEQSWTTIVGGSVVAHSAVVYGTDQSVSSVSLFKTVFQKE